MKQFLLPDRTKQTKKKAFVLALLQCHMPTTEDSVDVLTVTSVYAQNNHPSVVFFSL